MELVPHRARILEEFKCQNTGNCCLYPGYVYVNEENIMNMSKELDVTPSFFKTHFVQQMNGWNVIASPNFRTQCFLDESHKCQVYESRPVACKTYPDWDVIWENESSLQKEAESCKGLANAIRVFSSQKKPS